MSQEVKFKKFGRIPRGSESEQLVNIETIKLCKQNDPWFFMSLFELHKNFLGVQRIKFITEISKCLVIKVKIFIGYHGG